MPWPGRQRMATQTCIPKPRLRGLAMAVMRRTRSPIMRVTRLRTWDSEMPTVSATAWKGAGRPG